ncbi:signal recognition particle-docking protein FtsY [Butyrivibrio sp. CB08]|uniref:signal recognition particle-docking protein FtsY n=1 Tax=Butyrivibrio sp. CB08 TaxID=2364879 RepID=UPI000EA904E8|nr:signal recognition particle-docking protein FtsY [Butyrivibrio sp. CB08]RKM57521.1 signal recognition particle-docking protein FtsY [Butyrivibrio sp. CB08]
MAMNFFKKLQNGLAKTRDTLLWNLDNVIYESAIIDEDFYEELEEVLIMGDIGVNATSRIMDDLRAEVKKQSLVAPSQCRNLLVETIRKQMETGENAYDFEEKKTVVFIIGVNGVGKTTSVGKLAANFKNKGKKVIIAAADTYRAAATEQLEEWAKRADCPIITGREGGDPASVIYDAASAFKARDCDILIVDTAGRLHNKKNLMEELAKMNRIIDKELPGIYRENLIVLDGTTGQNAIMQAREFGEAADLTGIILTKLDGTSKGGIAVAIVSELNIPVKYIGVGEGIDDLERFNSDDFVNALFQVNKENTEESADDQGEK